jgi:hypothetical protein
MLLFLQDYQDVFLLKKYLFVIGVLLYMAVEKKTAGYETPIGFVQNCFCYETYEYLSRNLKVSSTKPSQLLNLLEVSWVYAILSRYGEILRNPKGFV